MPKETPVISTAAMNEAGKNVRASPQATRADLTVPLGTILWILLMYKAYKGEIAISYMNEPFGYDQQYVPPAYILQGTASGGRRFSAVVRAIPDKLLRVDPSLTGSRLFVPLSTGKE